MKDSLEIELTADLAESAKEAIGRRVRISLLGIIHLETKPDKFDNRILAFTACRLFILHAKSPCKIDWTFNYLDIEAIESKTSEMLTLTVCGKLYRVRARREPLLIDRMVEAITGALKTIFPSVPLERIIRRIDLSPAERQTDLHVYLSSIRDCETGPCGGYSKMYACMCDYHNLSYRDEVSWDVDTIYHAHNTREFCLQDFDHLDPNDMVPIISALEYNTWFTCIRSSNVQLNDKSLDQLVKVVQKSAHLEELKLDNIGAKSAFIKDISLALFSNSSTAVHSIDFSGNVIDEKAAHHLTGHVCRAPTGLTYLNLSKSSLTSKSLNGIAYSLGLNRYMSKTLKTLILSDNIMKEDAANLYSFLAQPNAISTLDLHGTDINLETLFGALQRGCTQHLTNLNVSQNSFPVLKRHRYNYVPQPSFKQYFAATLALRQVDMSYVRGFTCDVLKALFLSVASNPNLNELELSLRGNDLKSTMATQIMETCLPDIPCITGIDLCDNGLDQEFAAVLLALSRNQALKKLALGRNFGGVKSKRLSNVLHALVHLLHNESSRLEVLDVQDCRFRSGTSLILSALGTNQHLKCIDISGNGFGNSGARVLAKALQVNTKLESVFLDRNCISDRGFEDLAWGLQQNYSVRRMPYPVTDVCDVIRQSPHVSEPIFTSLRKVEALLWRNSQPEGLHGERLQRLQQAAYASTSSQVLEQLQSQLQDLLASIKQSCSQYVRNSANLIELQERVNMCRNNTDGYKQLVARLHEVGFLPCSDASALTASSAAAAASVVGNGVEMNGNIKTGSDPLGEALVSSMGYACDAMDSELRKRVDAMCQQTGVLFPDLFDRKVRFREELLGGARMSEEFLADMRTRLDEQMRQRMREMLLESAARLAQRVFDDVVEEINLSHELLDEFRRVSVIEEKAAAAEAAARKEKKGQVTREADASASAKESLIYGRLVRPASELASGEHGEHILTLARLAELRECAPSPSEIPQEEPLASAHGKLEHVVKQRPKPKRKSKATRYPVNPSSSDHVNDHAEGVELFFGALADETMLEQPNQNESITSEDSHAKKAKRKGFSFSSLFSSSSSHEASPGNLKSKADKNPHKAGVQKSDSLRNKKPHSKPAAAHESETHAQPRTPVQQRKHSSSSVNDSLEQTMDLSEPVAKPTRRSGGFSPSDAVNKSLLAEMKKKQTTRMGTLAETHPAHEPQHESGSRSDLEHTPITSAFDEIHNLLSEVPPPVPPRYKGFVNTPSQADSSRSSDTPPPPIPASEKPVMVPKNAVPMFGPSVGRSKSFYTQEEQETRRLIHQKQQQHLHSKQHSSNSEHNTNGKSSNEDFKSTRAAFATPHTRQNSEIKARVKSLFADNGDQ